MIETCNMCGHDNATTSADLAEWASLNLFLAASGLRMSASGASDPLPPEDEATIRRVLTERVGPGWRPGPAWAERADNAVREFVLAALEETAPRSAS